jgi:DNA primase
VQKLLDEAMPMVQLLWQRETEGRDFDSPERKAALDKALREKIKLIRDPSIRAHYGQTVKELRWQLFNPSRRGPPGQARTGKWHPIPTARASTKSSLLVAAGEDARTHVREAVILASLLCCPQLCDEFEDALEGMECTDPDHDRLRELILRYAPEGADVLRQRIEAVMGAEALERLWSQPHVAITPAVRRRGDTEAARMTIAEELAKLKAEVGWTAEVSEASEEIAGIADEAMTWRLGQAAETRNRAQRSQQEDKAEYEVGDNGARISRDERDAFDALLERINYSKSGH